MLLDTEIQHAGGRRGPSVPHTLVDGTGGEDPGGMLRFTRLNRRRIGIDDEQRLRTIQQSRVLNMIVWRCRANRCAEEAQNYSL